MSAYFKPYPLGHSINGSPHSVCVSLPTMADLVGYEEKDPRVLGTFAAGYPRFYRNPVIRRLADTFARDHGIGPEDPLLPTRAAVLDLCHFLRLEESAAEPINDFWTVRLPEDDRVREACRCFLQHTGCALSSREAEAVLVRDYGEAPHPEERRDAAPEENLALIRESLHAIYGTASVGDIHIFRSGMNAFYTGFRALQAVQLRRDRDLWIQLGWLYVDTARILERFALPGADPVTVYNVLDLDGLREILSTEGHRVAGIVTEVPTNPLVQTPDLQALRELADRYKAGLILDPTLVSPHNVNVLPYADLHINSLTKYAAVEADVMMGAVALNAESSFYDDLAPLLPVLGTPPAEGDIARMAAQIPGYPQTVKQINATTLKVAGFLESHPAVEQVFWARTQPSGYNYTWLQHLEGGPGGIITFTLNKPLAGFYDPSHIVKSPSFGARFTMMCPFMYLAHYDLASKPEGRAFMQAQGVDPDLIRLSIGLEPPEAIIAELDRTL